MRLFALWRESIARFKIVKNVDIMLIMDEKQTGRRTLIVKRHFDAAHRLINYDGDCANLHGHRWEVEFHIEAEELNNGIAFDFTKVKTDLDGLLPDHKYLNDIVEQPTAEIIAEYLYDLVVKSYPLEKVVVWETPECAATFCR